MSDLPNSVAIPHRQAHRNHVKKLDAKSEAEKGEKAMPAKPKKQATAKPAKVKAKQIARPGQGLKQTDIVAFNQGAEKAAVQFLTDYILEKGPPAFNVACNLIALELDVSTETGKRYLRKYSVDHPKAPFCIENGYVTLRSK